MNLCNSLQHKCFYYLFNVYPIVLFRIICDSWIELGFPESTISEKLLLKVIKLRSQWQELLRCRLEGECQVLMNENSL